MKRTVSLVIAVCLLNSILAWAQVPAANKIDPSIQQSHTPESLPELNASEALELMESGALTSEDYVRALLQRADSLQSLNVFISRDSAAALAAARQADQRRALD